MDPAVVDVACAGLNGLKMGDRTLTVRRAAEVKGGGGRCWVQATTHYNASLAQQSVLLKAALGHSSCMPLVTCSAWYNLCYSPEGNALSCLTLTCHQYHDICSFGGQHH